jgi:hypothetical protein
VPRSYCLTYYNEERNHGEREKNKNVHKESDFATLRRIIEEKGLEEYSIRRISLEDIYLELTAEHEEEND